MSDSCYVRPIAIFAVLFPKTLFIRNGDDVRKRTYLSIRPMNGIFLFISKEKKVNAQRAHQGSSRNITQPIGTLVLRLSLARKFYKYRKKRQVEHTHLVECEMVSVCIFILSVFASSSFFLSNSIRLINIFVHLNYISESKRRRKIVRVIVFAILHQTTILFTFNFASQMLKCTILLL